MSSAFAPATAGLLLAASFPLAAAAQGRDADADLSALLKRQTQAFSEAGQAGDTATMGRYLDDDVVFMNETGEIVSKAQMIKDDGTPPKVPTDRKIEVTDWALRTQGGGQTATATFVDVLTQQFHGQTLVMRFRSTETWAKRPDGWKMIASQTMNVQKDPPAVTLPSATLDEYVGLYQVDESLKVRIARTADGLTASVNGGSPTAIRAELQDVFFIAGAPNVRRIFQRDAHGRVTGYVSRRDGVDTVAVRIT